MTRGGRIDMRDAPERRRVRVADQVSDRDAARRLLEREVTEARENERELLFVVRPARRFGGALHEDDADVPRVHAGERAHGVRQLIVRDEEPAPVRLVDASCSKLLAKDAHVLCARANVTTRFPRAAPSARRTST